MSGFGPKGTALRQFLEMERAKPVLAERFLTDDGDNLWPIIRTAYSTHLGIDGNISRDVFSLDEIRIVLETLAGNIPRPSKKGAVVVFSEKAIHSEKIDGTLFDPYLDPVVNVLRSMGKETVKIIVDFREGDKSDAEEFFCRPAVLKAGIGKIFRKKTREPEIFHYYMKMSEKFGIPYVPWNAVAFFWMHSCAWRDYWRGILAEMSPGMVSWNATTAK